MANGTMTAPNAKPTNDLRQFLTACKGQIESALQKHMDPDRVIRLALTAVVTNPELLKCTKESVYLAILKASQLGLEIDGRHAYLVPYGGVAQFQPGYLGFIKLAYQNPRVTSFEAHEVRANDLFDYALGTDTFVRHRPELKDRGDLIAAYAVVKIDGRPMPLIEVMGEEAILKRRDSSQSKNSATSPWKKWPDEMWRKTVAKAIAKYAPLGPQVATLAQYDDDIEAHGTSHVLDLDAPQPKSAGRVRSSTLNIPQTPVEDISQDTPNAEPECQATPETDTASEASQDEPENIATLREALAGCRSIGEVHSTKAGHAILFQNDKKTLDAECARRMKELGAN